MNTMHPVAAPREIGVNWAEISRGTRRALDVICGVGPKLEYRFGVFLAGGSHHPEWPAFPGPNVARLAVRGGEHVRRGLVIGTNSFGRERIRWEDEAWVT